LKLFRNNTGFTLLELIISIAILGIIAIALLSAFTTGFTGILSSGKYSHGIYEGQEALEKRMAGLPVTDEPAITDSTVNNVDLGINFGVTPGVVVNGNIEIVDYNDGKNVFKLAVFIPD